ncbi:MAG: histidine kinase [Muribaculaceae bacterium]|nr:histidine kinase [Alistipes senegalensis]MCM1474386.1 histidine kinase [Muribaculaceae bacterium]
MILSLILLFIGLAGMSFSFIWIIRKGNNNRLTRLFGVCQLSIILWLISQLLIIFSVTLQQKRISYTIGNLGISFFAPFWLMFSAEYTDLSFRKIFRIMPVISLTSVILVTTNPVFHLYYSVFETDKIEYASGFYIYQVIYYICIVYAMILMFIRKKGISAGLLILSTAVPLAVNTLTVTGTINARIELTPLFFAFSSMMILIAIGRYGLLDINSIAIKDVIDNLNTGVIIYTPDGRVSYKNNFINENLSGTDFPDVPEVLVNGKYLSFRRSHCNDNGKRVAEIVTVSDVTEYHRLSIERERSRIAQEIHDSAGHTFTMISSVARILEAEIYTEKTSDSMLEYIREIDGLARSGITQLRCSINNLRDENFMTSVTQAVKTVADTLRGGAELCIQGEDTGIYNFCIREVYENTREAVTNSVRNGAERIDIIIKFSPEYLELYVLDNGKGCENISEHGGLSGIRDRTEKLGGTVRFLSVYGEGFSVIMKIPSRSDII